jgi:benzoyl-CoA reductase/2-hydroxyglutaryl-CoA dehydratase subunit BcrC/BadD/HgdB
VTDFAAVLRNRDQLARQYHAQGGVVVGYLNTDVPEELILASGAFPLRVLGDVNGKTLLADEYIKPGFNPVARAVFNRILDGSTDFLDRLIFSNLDESFVRLFYLTREIKRQGLKAAIPNIYFFEFLHTKHALHYNLDRLRDFKHHLEALTGNPIMDDALCAAIALCNENRQLLAQAAALRTEFPPRISGSDALPIIASSTLMPKAEHNAALRQFLAEDHQASTEGTARIYVEGHLVDDCAFYQMVEASGATIVAESNRAFDALTDTDGDPLEAINRRYLFSGPHPSKSTIQARVDTCVQQVESAQVDGVIFAMVEGQHPPHWDYPEQEKALYARGIPTLCLPWQPSTMANDENVRQQVASFIESLKTEVLP